MNQVTSYLENINLIPDLVNGLVKNINKVSEEIINCYKNDGKVVVFGNGGSASQAEHFAVELVVKIKDMRKSLPAISLNSNCAILSAIGNDFDFNYVFERQVESCVINGDVVIGISTSGKSKNVIEAINEANRLEGITVGLTGNDSCELAKIVKYPIVVKNKYKELDTQIIQDVHQIMLHYIALKVDEEFKNGAY